MEMTRVHEAQVVPCAWCGAPMPLWVVTTELETWRTWQCDPGTGGCGAFPRTA